MSLLFSYIAVLRHVVLIDVKCFSFWCCSTFTCGDILFIIGTKYPKAQMKTLQNIGQEGLNYEFAINN